MRTDNVHMQPSGYIKSYIRSMFYLKNKCTTVMLELQYQTFRHDGFNSNLLYK